MYRWNIFTFFPSNNRLFLLDFFPVTKCFHLRQHQAKRSLKVDPTPPPFKSQGNSLNLQRLRNHILMKNEEYKDTSKHDDRLNLLSDWKIREVRHRVRAKHDFQKKNGRVIPPDTYERAIIAITDNSVWQQRYPMLPKSLNFDSKLFILQDIKIEKNKRRKKDDLFSN